MLPEHRRPLCFVKPLDDECNHFHRLQMSDYRVELAWRKALVCSGGTARARRSASCAIDQDSEREVLSIADRTDNSRG
jgi:hypothetical protein